MLRSRGHDRLCARQREGVRVLQSFNATEQMLVIDDGKRQLRFAMRILVRRGEKDNGIAGIFLAPEKQGSGPVIKHTRDSVFARGKSPATGYELKRNVDDELIGDLSLPRDSEDGKAGQHQEQTQV